MHCRLVGSGPVGLAFALFARRAGLGREQVGLDHARVRSLALGRSSGPRRQLAISEGSRQLLARVVDFPPAATIESIDVELAGRAGRTRIRACDFGLPVLGHVLSWDSLACALARATVDAFALETCADREPPPSGSDLVVHAEGLIEEPAADRLAFGQSALLAEVRLAHPAPHRATAYERFDRHGPLALLPIGSGADRFSLVWCDENTRTAGRMQRGAAAMEQELQARFGDRLGALSIEGPVEIAPLTRIRRRAPSRLEHHPDDPVAIWIGNASQTLHPVAGQGLNLGLRDAFELATRLGDLNEQCLVRRRSGSGAADSDRSLHQELQRMVAAFQQSRRFDRDVLVTVTDALARGFGMPLLHGLQSALLTALDVVPPLRRPLAATLLFGQRR